MIRVCKPCTVKNVVLIQSKTSSLYFMCPKKLASGSKGDGKKGRGDEKSTKTASTKFSGK